MIQPGLSSLAEFSQIRPRAGIVSLDGAQWGGHAGTSPRQEHSRGEVRGFVAKFDARNQPLIRAVRRALRKRMPAATELVYDNRFKIANIAKIAKIANIQDARSTQPLRTERSSTRSQIGQAVTKP